MPLPLPDRFVEFLLFGPPEYRRQIQDSPVLGDVWIGYARKPGEPQDLLIRPYKNTNAGQVAAEIFEEHQKLGRGRDAEVASVQGLVTCKLTFDELMTIVVPRTEWWVSQSRPTDDEDGQAHLDMLSYWSDEAMTKRIFDQTLKLLSSLQDVDAQELEISRPSGPDRLISLAAFIYWAQNRTVRKKRTPEETIDYVLEKCTTQELWKSLWALAATFDVNTATRTGDGDVDKAALIWQISLNRQGKPAISRSVGAVKADAAKTLFSVSCQDIAWAIFDSGIAGDHPAFHDDDGNLRVLRSYDFGQFRRIVNLSNLNDNLRHKNLADLGIVNDNAQLDKASAIAAHESRLDELSFAEADEILERLANDAKRGAPIHWESVEPLIRIKPQTPPNSFHGTHVAGILGANATDSTARGAGDGMCPDIKLYDFRILGPGIKDTEFAIIAALQFIRDLNERSGMMRIHGANLSLSIPHDVRNFACGRTPICDECERVVNSGVIVVAAAGNNGYQKYLTEDGSYAGYAAFSVTDPGNADSVLTVGSTHRYWPHTYGVSFFSSRGPTGDGRLKPDLVAPGEKIRAPIPNGQWGDSDGTSMSAPHVSGAAAMLMARYSELIGQPRRVKQILCDSATDLGRDRSFQGSGMLDVLRAFQSI